MNYANTIRKFIYLKMCILKEKGKKWENVELLIIENKKPPITGAYSK